jgi:hypothetical protein
MQGVMAPPKRHPTRPLMLSRAAPLHPTRGLMSVEARAFADFDLQLELRRLLWSGVVVLLLLLYLLHVVGTR